MNEKSLCLICCLDRCPLQVDVERITEGEVQCLNIREHKDNKYNSSVIKFFPCVMVFLASDAFPGGE